MSHTIDLEKTKKITKALEEMGCQIFSSETKQWSVTLVVNFAKMTVLEGDQPK